MEYLIVIFSDFNTIVDKCKNEKPILFGLESDFYEHDTRVTVETEYADILEYLVKVGLKS